MSSLRTGILSLIRFELGLRLTNQKLGVVVAHVILLSAQVPLVLTLGLWTWAWQKMEIGMDKETGKDIEQKKSWNRIYLMELDAVVPYRSSLPPQLNKCSLWLKTRSISSCSNIILKRNTSIQMSSSDFRACCCTLFLFSLGFVHFLKEVRWKDLFLSKI